MDAPFVKQTLDVECLSHILVVDLDNIVKTPKEYRRRD